MVVVRRPKDRWRDGLKPFYLLSEHTTVEVLLVEVFVHFTKLSLRGLEPVAVAPRY